ncbi:hypothetical protein NSE_0830 [Neorickettsia sennetsu str. Miyayama]|uniref:Uncharacterized protein n=1 Tax=Ehrlichia sennetsu (strain ATCC VR-367 / Miyayama) TaxID=222891 RepID=Q2GCU6_EHRS3|nr:hypothetical protein NSE_0830 [Neorickettsia sennetsu str. Miyayama]
MRFVTPPKSTDAENKKQGKDARVHYAEGLLCHTNPRNPRIITKSLEIAHNESCTKKEEVQIRYYLEKS